MGFRVRGAVRVRDGAGLRVRDRVGIRNRVRAWSEFGFLCFSSSVLELKICPCGEKQVHCIDFTNITDGWLKSTSIRQ